MLGTLYSPPSSPTSSSVSRRSRIAHGNVFGEFLIGDPRALDARISEVNPDLGGALDCAGRSVRTNEGPTQGGSGERLADRSRHNKLKPRAS